MKLRNPWLIRLAAVSAAWLIRCWMGTVRRRFHRNVRAVDPGEPDLKERYIYAFWHDTMLFPAAHRTKAMRVLISQHADGELIAQICQRIGWEVVRGSSTRGGVEAIRQVMRQGRNGHLSVTPDGPHGPRRQVQPGIVYLASRTGMAIVPIGIGYQRAWRAKSWDRFAVPVPWSTATCVAGPVIHVPQDLDKEGIEDYRKRVEEALLTATAEAEAWAERRAGRGGNRKHQHHKEEESRRVA